MLDRFAILTLAMGVTLLALGGALTASAVPEAASTLPNKRYVLLVASDSGGPPTTTPTPRPATPTSAPPTATPTATPPPTSGTVYTSGALLWRDSINYWHITGIVTNGLNVPIEFVEITGRFYSAAGQLLTTSTTYSRVSKVTSGASAPFEVIHSNVAGIATAEVEVTDYATSNYYPVITGLDAQITNSFIDSIGYGHLVGTVTNRSTQTWDFVEPVAALVRGGRVVDVSTTFTKPRALAPGQTGTFEMLFSPHEGFTPVSFVGTTLTLWVDASKP